METHSPPDPASHPERPPGYVGFQHPENNYIFLEIIKNVKDPNSESITYGVCYCVAYEACKIIACNQAGYLSTSRDRNNVAAKLAPASGDQVLTLNTYFYHVDVQAMGSYSYPICIDFEDWSFPHGELPDFWNHAPPDDHPDMTQQKTWTAQSIKIRFRDKLCRISSWEDGKTTAHIVPKDNSKWMTDNRMEVYSISKSQQMCCDDSRNLFALRFDLHKSQFDEGNCVIVPIAGRMCVYYIQPAAESEFLYHLQEFDTTDLSHEYLYARFAWAVLLSVHTNYKRLNDTVKHSIKISQCSEDNVSPKAADGDDIKEGGPGPSKKRRRENDTESGEKKAKTKGKGRRKKGTKATLDVQELAEDIEKAKIVAPFFLAPEKKASPYTYESMMWYPGHRFIDRLKDEYIRTHPSVRAHSDELDVLPDVDDPLD